MLVVSDSSPLIALAQIDHLWLLERLFGRVYVPDAVWREVVTGGRPPVSEQIPRQSWIERAAIDPQMTLELAADEGEAQAIVLAVQMRADYLLIDERRAREIARRHGLAVIGTIGILLEARRRNEVAEITPLLDELVAKGFRISSALYEAARVQAGEQPAT